MARISSRTDSTGNPVKNRLLLAIPEAEFDLMRPHLQPVSLHQRFILHETGEKVLFAYFLNEGLSSSIILMNDGRSVEISVTGREGLVGTPLTVGLTRGPYRAIMQIAGSALKIEPEALQAVLAEAPELSWLLRRYVLLNGLQIAQIAACNRLHGLEERLARWLLMCQDRVDLPVLPITHEFLSQMLGTGRPSVSLAAGILEQAGLIENLRGNVRITNREGLEKFSCECYAVIQRISARAGASADTP